MLTMLESLNYSFRNPKNIISVIYRIKQLRNYKKNKNHGVLRGPQLDKQRWRARLGILRVKRNKLPVCVKSINVVQTTHNKRHKIDISLKKVSIPTNFENN